MTLQRKATIISSITAFLLAIIKLIIGIFINSIAIISSAIDSILDMFISIFNLFAINNAEKNPDKKFNYGRWKIEALASFLEWLIIIFSWIFIFYESIRKFIFKEEISEVQIWIYVMIFSVFITFLLVLFLNYVWKKTNNLVIKSDALHYKTDLLSNGAILIWLLFIYFFKIYFIDSILWIIISIYIIFSTINILKKWFLLLLDASLEEKEVSKILEILKNEKKLENFHEFKTRQSGGIKFVEAHLVFSEDISLLNAHDISHIIEEKIRKLDKKSKWSILFHLDPYDDFSEDLKKK